MAVNGHETVSFKGADTVNAEMNGVPFREEDGLVSVLALSLGLASIRIPHRKDPETGNEQTFQPHFHWDSNLGSKEGKFAPNTTEPRPRW
ncbi:hypothetical protein NC651_005166 [Populus alba x Populus x berolinensis]|nr:hypothetical protein NC651_005166 [Populus alba x Populus x berolinensis]